MRMPENPKVIASIKWIRSHPAIFAVLPSALVCVFLAVLVGPCTPDVLNGSSVVSVVGVLLGGNLAVIAVLQPSLKELRSVALHCEEELREMAFAYESNVQRELKQNFEAVVVAFIGVFVLACFEHVIADAFCGISTVVVCDAFKMFAVAISVLALVDTTMPSFQLAEIVSKLQSVEQGSSNGGA